MIDTTSLKEGDKVKVWLASDESEYIEGSAICMFKNGVFVNIEDNHHRNEVYGSSVVKFKKIK